MTGHLRERAWVDDIQILQFSIYCSHATSGVNSQRSFKMGNRVSYYEGSADVEKEVTKYVQNQCGDMAVAGGSIYPLPSLQPQSTSGC